MILFNSSSQPIFHRNPIIAVVVVAYQKKMKKREVEGADAFHHFYTQKYNPTSYKSTTATVNRSTRYIIPVASLEYPCMM